MISINSTATRHVADPSVLLEFDSEIGRFGKTNLKLGMFTVTQ